jgi:hypothetical protein
MDLKLFIKRKKPVFIDIYTLKHKNSTKFEKKN